MQEDEHPQPLERSVGWGPALRIEVDRQPGGLYTLVELIHQQVGREIGTRTSFMPLWRAGGPDYLGEKERRRAWFLLVACGQNPAEWGIDDDVLPPAWYRDRVRLARMIRHAVETERDRRAAANPRVRAGTAA